MTTRQPEALRLAEILEGGYSLAWLYERGGYEVSAELRTQHARITALESQLAQRFDAADMATAAAQGFRDGATATAQPVAERHYGPLRDADAEYGQQLSVYSTPRAQPAQQGVAYAELPESFLEIPDVQDESGINAYYSREVVLECIDAALASHGQAPADAKALAEADRRAGEAERLLATCKEYVMRFEQVRGRMKYQWGADQRVSFDEVWAEALALKKAAQTDSVQEDAARYRWLAASCRSTSEHWGGRWSIIIDGPAPKSHDSEDDFDAAVDAARKQGANQ